MSLNVYEENHSVEIVQYPAKLSLGMRFWTLDFIFVPFFLISGAVLQFEDDSLTNISQISTSSYLLLLSIGITVGFLLYILLLLFYRHQSTQRINHAPLFLRPTGIAILFSLLAFLNIVFIILPSSVFRISLSSIICYLLAICYFSLSHELKQGFLVLISFDTTAKNISIKYIHSYIGWKLSIDYHFTTSTSPECIIKYTDGTFTKEQYPSMYLTEDRFNTITANINTSGRFDLYLHTHDISKENKTYYLIFSTTNVSELHTAYTAIKHLFGEFKVMVPPQNVRVPTILNWYFI